MKIAIDISPISQEGQTKHSVRGVGSYIRSLRDALVKRSGHEFIFFDKENGIPSGVDLVHYPYFEPFSLSLPVYNRIPTVVTVHDVTPLIFPSHFPPGMKGKLKWHLQKRILRRMNHLITDSNVSKKDIVRLVGMPEDRVSSIYLAASEIYKPITDSGILQSVANKYKLPRQFVLYVGDVTWNKNLPSLLEAMNVLGVPLVMVGKALIEENYDKRNVWNEDLVKLQNIAQSSSNIVRLGFVSDQDLVALYNLATVFVMPSLYEGFGLPLVEAMQSGCPVVTSKEGSIPEVVSDAGYFINPYDVESMRNGIREVVSSNSLQKILREKGILQAKKFSWEKTGMETVMAYEKVLLS